MRKQNFYFALDSLIDTRIGLLMQHWPERVNVVDFAKYRTRVTNYVWEYFGVDKEAWNLKWKNRTSEVLLNSGPTEMFLRLTELLMGAGVRHATGKAYAKPLVTVNIWPYYLEDWEIMEVRKSIKDAIVQDVDIEVIYTPVNEVKPEYAKERWDVMMIYDLPEFLELQQENLKVAQMPGVVIHYPAVISEGTEDDVKNLKGQIGPFNQLRFYLSEYMCLDALDVSLWSLPPVLLQDPQPRP